jgi:hypothetical protein
MQAHRAAARIVDIYLPDCGSGAHNALVAAVMPAW